MTKRAIAIAAVVAMLGAPASALAQESGSDTVIGSGSISLSVGPNATTAEQRAERRAERAAQRDARRAAREARRAERRAAREARRAARRY